MHTHTRSLRGTYTYYMYVKASNTSVHNEIDDEIYLRERRETIQINNRAKLLRNRNELSAHRVYTYIFKIEKKSTGIGRKTKVNGVCIYAYRLNASNHPSIHPNNGQIEPLYCHCHCARRIQILASKCSNRMRKFRCRCSTDNP